MMRNLHTLFFLLGLLALGTAVQAAELPDNKGKDFWIAFPSNYNGGTPILFISSDVATSGTIEIPGLGFSTTFTTQPDSITTVTLLSNHEIQSTDDIEDKGIHITAGEELTVYGLNRLDNTTDAFLSLPTNILGNYYIVSSYTGKTWGSQLTVVGTENATSLTISPTASTSNRAAGIPYTINLEQGQVYQLRTSTSIDSDLTGSIITSNKPVAVFGSANCANIPINSSACDHIVEQLPPVSTWGKSFISAPLKTRDADIYRFLASEDSTEIMVNGSLEATLNTGDFYEQLYDSSMHISADKPIQVIQYSRGTSTDGVLGDPFMMLIPPYEQFLGEYTISTSDVKFSANFINLVVPASAIGDVRVDGVIVPVNSFSAVGSSGFYTASISISLGSHTVKSLYPVGVHVYGFGTTDSYGYPGGQSLAQIAQVTSISLTPNTSTALVDDSSCVEAKVYDNFNEEVHGARIDFFIDGVATTSGFAFTDTLGIAQYCYTQSTAGIDSIFSKVGGLISNVVHKTWISKDAPRANAGDDQILYTGSTDCLVPVILDGSATVSPEGDALSYRWTGLYADTVYGVGPSLNLSVGQHIITLLATDEDGLTNTDNVMITVLDTTAPLFGIVADTIVILPKILLATQIDLNQAPATDNCSSPVNVEASRDDALELDELYFEGQHFITWNACDSSGNCATAAQSVFVEHQKDQLTQPYLELIDSANVIDSIFADSIRFVVRTSDSLVSDIKIKFSQNGDPFYDDINYWVPNDTITIFNTHHWKIVASAPGYKNSDILTEDWINDNSFFVKDYPPSLTFVSSSIDTLAMQQGNKHTVQGLLRAKYTGTSYNTIDSLRIRMTNEQNDTLYIWLLETDVNTSIFEGSIAMHLTYIPPVTTDGYLTARMQNKIIGNKTEVKAEFADDPRIYATISIETNFVPLESAVMLDLDKNGQGDALLLTFTAPVKQLPVYIDTLYWDHVLPENYHSIDGSRIDYFKPGNTIDSTILYVDLADIQEQFNGTGTTLGEQPYLTLPFSLEFGGQKIIISDGVSPVLDSVVKIPGANIDSDEFTSNDISPDTYIFSFSEPLVYDSANFVDHWNQIFLFDRDCDGYGEYRDYADIAQVDSLGMVWEAKLSNVYVGNCIVVNGDLIYFTDTDTNGVAVIKTIITGKNRTKPTVDMLDPISNPKANPHATWVPPGQDVAVPASPDQSVLSIISTQTYSYEIHIFDMLGNFVVRLKDDFGSRGEMEHATRQTQNGVMNYVPWNLRDSSGRKVGSGVYIWHVKIKYFDGSANEYMVKSGVLRSN